MSEQTIVLLACLAIIAVLAVLIYVLSRSHATALSSLCELRRSLDQIQETLKRHGHALYDAHKLVHAVTKGVEKQPS